VARSWGFRDLIKSWWDEAHVEGYDSFVIVKKLKLVKMGIKKWNKEVFGDINGFY